MINLITNKTFSFNFKTPFRVLQKVKLDELLSIDAENLSSTDLLNFSLIITPYKKFEITISLSEHMSFPFAEESLSLLEAKNMVILSAISKCCDYNIIEEHLEVAFELFEEHDEIEEDYKDFLHQHAYEGTCMALCCYPNLLKTNLCFNFFDAISSDEQLALICSENPSPIKLLQVFFPLMKKKSLQSIKNVFCFNGEESEAYMHNSFSLSFLKIFKNEDKFSMFFNKVTSFYQENFDDYAYISQAGLPWSSYRDYDAFRTTISSFLGKNEHSYENFFINSIDPITFEIESHHDHLDMGDDIFDGQLDVFQMIEFYITDFERTLSSIERFFKTLNRLNPKYKKILEFHKRFLKKYRARDLVSLHDAFAFHLNDLNDMLNGEAHFGSNENIDPSLLYNYEEETVEFFNDSINDFEFKLAESGADLQFLGSRMRHCVAGYHSEIAENKNHFIVGVFEKEKPVLCLEILNNEIIQAKKQNNRRINRSLSSDRELISSLREYFIERELEVNTSDLISLKF